MGNLIGKVDFQCFGFITVCFKQGRQTVKAIFPDKCIASIGTGNFNGGDAIISCICR